ncbi:hypothetical protein VPH35_107651 [Triticum aestivum]
MPDEELLNPLTVAQCALARRVHVSFSTRQCINSANAQIVLSVPIGCCMLDRSNTSPGRICLPHEGKPLPRLLHLFPRRNHSLLFLAASPPRTPRRTPSPLSLAHGEATPRPSPSCTPSGWKPELELDASSAPDDFRVDPVSRLPIFSDVVSQRARI